MIIKGTYQFLEIQGSATAQENQPKENRKPGALRKGASVGRTTRFEKCSTSYLLIHRAYIMSKRRRLGSQDVEFLFDQINVALNEEGIALTPNPQELSQVLKRLKEKVLDKVASKTIAAKEFNIKKATLAFGLQYRDLGNEYLWKIEDNVPLPNSATPSLGKVPRNFESCCYHTMSLDEFYLKYSRTFDRSAQASCRMFIDHILMEC